jgi:hypothetical protein
VDRGIALAGSRKAEGLTLDRRGEWTGRRVAGVGEASGGGLALGQGRTRSRVLAKLLAAWRLAEAEWTGRGMAGTGGASGGLGALGEAGRPHGAIKVRRLDA